MPTRGTNSSSFSRRKAFGRSSTIGAVTIEPDVHRQRHGYLRHDLAALVQQVDLENVIHVGHSTGGGDVARYIGRHGTDRVAKAVLVGAVPPGLLKTAKNPDGVPIEE
jgi:pimeloyl-ACP methyl ester carboxylesterase